MRNVEEYWKILRAADNEAWFPQKTRAGEIEGLRVITSPLGFRLEDLGYQGVKVWYPSDYYKWYSPKIPQVMARKTPGIVLHEVKGDTCMALVGYILRIS